MNLQLPKTIRPATEADVPKTGKTLERVKQARTANIEEGYSLRDVKDEAYKFYAEINIDNDKLWQLMESLSARLPDKAALLIGLDGDELRYGTYTDKQELLKKLKQFETELREDVFLEWGLIYHDDNRLEEIFVTSSKYLKVWGADKENFTGTMSAFGLNHKENIEFIDEYPKVRQPLWRIRKEVVDSSEVVRLLLD